MTEDTKFPEWMKYWNLDYTDYTVIISRLEMDYWFKRCMEDSPILETKYGLWEEWYNKWFNQFETSQTEEQEDE